MTTPATLPATLPEAAFTRTVIDYATRRGWRVAHHRPAQTANGWRTPTQGHVGCPDLILARDGRVLLAELKSHAGRATPEQRAWLAAAGGHGRLWRPAQWADVIGELA